MYVPVVYLRMELCGCGFLSLSFIEYRARQQWLCNKSFHLCVLWFNFILGFNFVSFVFGYVNV